MGKFYSCYVFLHEFFAVLTTFWRIYAKSHELLASILCCWCLGSLYYFWHPCCCGSPFCCWLCNVPIVSAAVGLRPCYWPPSMLLASLHAVGGFTGFASIPAFDGVQTVLLALLLLPFMQLLAFLLLWAVTILMSSLMLLVAGVTVVSCCWRYCCCLCHCCCLHPDCGRHSCCCWHPLSCWRSYCWSLCYCWRSWCKQWCCWRFCVPFEHAVAGGPAGTGFLLLMAF
jgi:hypothetical protein